MKGTIVALVLLSLIGCALSAFAQAPRQDALWARTYGGSITLDGALSEPGWAKAESIRVRYGVDNGLPGSGWKLESGVEPTDPTYATVKFLVVGNQLYMGAMVPDASVGGSKDFNRFDGFLMSIKDHSNINAPKPPTEYTYAWWYPTTTDPQPVDESPSFVGKWATWPPGTARTPEQIANWDAVTVVHGHSNSDTETDQGYTVEMRFNLAPMGYDVTRAQGDIVEFNISVYDCDWFWPFDAARMSANRAWWQGPWANAAWYNEVRLCANPAVTTELATLPVINPEMAVPNGSVFPEPVIDGQLSEAVWGINGIHLGYGDDAARQTYPSVGPYRAGQYQPPVNGGQAAVIDPADAWVKVFFRGDKLYMGFDVNDKFVQYHPSFDRWDGFLVSINDLGTRGPDNNLIGRRLSFQVGPDGAALPQDYLLTLVQQGAAQVALALKPGTTVDTTDVDTDTGYTAELAIDLTHLGYPSGLGDKTLFLGVTMLDGDSFTNYTDSYGTRTWWFREYENDCCPVWAYMDPSFLTTASVSTGGAEGGDLARLDISPNPFVRSAALSYTLPQPSLVSMEVFDVRGRRVQHQDLGLRFPGRQQAFLNGTGQGSGVYLCRLQMKDPVTGRIQSTLSGKVLQVQ